jgi:hypothetical protein
VIVRRVFVRDASRPARERRLVIDAARPGNQKPAAASRDTVRAEAARRAKLIFSSHGFGSTNSIDREDIPVNRTHFGGNGRQGERNHRRANCSLIEPLETRCLLSASLVFNQQPTATPVGAAVAPSIVVYDEDATGHIIGSGNSLVTLSIASGPAGATLAGNASVRAAYGIATFANVIPSAAGTYTLTATAADGSATPVTSAAFVVSDVGGFRSTTTTLASSTPFAVIGGTTVYTATVHAAAGGTPTGAVQFFDDGVPLGAKPLQADGTATFVASGLSAGSHMITASYWGDSTYTASNSAAIVETVGAVVTSHEGPSLVASVDGTRGVPFALVPGNAGKVDVTIHNYGTGLAAGTVGVQLVATADGDPADGITLAAQPATAKLHLFGGDARTIHLSFTVPATFPVGSYSLMAELTPASGIAPSIIDASTQSRTAAAANVAYAFGTVGGRQGVALTRVEPDGTVVTYRLIGQGTGTLGGDGVTNPTVTLIGTTAGTVLSITTRGGSNHVTLGGINDFGSLAAINAPTATLDGTFDSQGSVGHLVLGGLSGSNLAAVSFGSVVIEGSVDSSKLLAGTSFGHDGQLGGSDDSYAPGQIGSIRVLGNVTASTFAAGLDPVDGIYNNGNDALIPGGRIGPVQIAGSLSDDSRILAASLPRIASVAHGSVATAADPRFALD